MADPTLPPDARIVWSDQGYWGLRNRVVETAQAFVHGQRSIHDLYPPLKEAVNDYDRFLKKEAHEVD